MSAILPNTMEMLDTAADARKVMLPRCIEWPTVAVAVSIFAVLAAVVAFQEHIPAPLTIGLLAAVGAWYTSLQHEVIHGHPTPWPWVNLAIGGTPLTIAMPFGFYRASHLAHHREGNLTSPLDDPESGYITPERWADAGQIERALLLALRTLAGRMLLWPAVIMYRTVRATVGSVVGGRGRWAAIRFTVAVAAILGTVQWTGLPAWQYALGAGYLGQSLSIVRSFAEHRAVTDGSRTAVVHAGVFWRLLFLNNSLHITHHARPGAAWYELPALHEQLGLEDEAARGAGVYRGYGEVFHRYLFRPFCHVVHPLS